MKALPYLSLPSSVEAFDGGLEPGFSGRSKDGGDSQAQTQTDHPSQSVAELVSTLETSVVIELGIGWQPKDLPMLDHGLDRCTSKDSAIWPRSNQTSVQRYGVKDLDVGSAFDDQTFDDIEAIELTTPLGHLRQIPTNWRWGMTPAAPTHAGKIFSNGSWLFDAYHPEPRAAPGCAQWCVPQGYRSCLGQAILVGWPQPRIPPRCFCP